MDSCQLAPTVTSQKALSRFASRFTEDGGDPVLVYKKQPFEELANPPNVSDKIEVESIPLFPHIKLEVLVLDECGRDMG